MKIKYTMMALCLLLTAGCSIEKGEETAPEASIVLSIDGIGQQADTRAAVLGWADTPVSVAYAEEGYDYTNFFDVTVTAASGIHVNTGMSYPVGNVPIRFVGYHPTAVPAGAGTVAYGITDGDVDVMVSNEISGKATEPIGEGTNTDKLVFEHKLTCITFSMKCSSDTESYPELVRGVTVAASTAAPLNTQAVLDLSTRAVSFEMPGTVLAGDRAGFRVPAFTEEPIVIDVLVQPGVPLSFKVRTTTDEKAITITNNDALWTSLQENGGEAGKRYLVNLEFSAISIHKYENVFLVDWQQGSNLNGDNPGAWW